MKREILKFLTLIAIFYLFFSVQEVFACSCGGIPTPYEAFKESKTVFIGKVIGVTDKNGKEIIEKKLSDLDSNELPERREGNRFYRFAIQKSFKGSKTSELTVGFNLNRCQFGYDIGDTILIYATESDKTLWTYSFCSRNAELEKALEEIFFIHGLLSNKPEPRIYGSVRLNFKDFYTKDFQNSYLKGIKVVAENKGRKFETFTNQDGLYWFNNIPNGDYKVYLNLPKKYQESWKNQYQIKLTKRFEQLYESFGQRTGRAAYADFEVYWNNEIKGKVLDAEGKQLERANVNLIPISQINNNTLFEKTINAERLAGANIYGISGMTPGKYILVAEVFAPFTTGAQKLLIYYPQESSPKNAEIIELGEFDKRNIDIKLPTGFVFREIEGTMFWEGGFPNKDGYVTLEKSENSNDPNNIVYDSQWVKDGKFKFQVFENAEYWLHAKAMQEIAKPIKIKVGKSNIPIKITLPEK